MFLFNQNNNEILQFFVFVEKIEHKTLMTIYVNYIKMSNFIENATILFHNKNGELPFQVVSESEDFGILRIKMKKTEITKKPLFILFTVDKTGSMSEYVKNDIKMNYLKQTFKNMLYYLAKQELDIYIRVHSFNVEIDVDIENIKITKENVSELCSKIMNIEPESSTNMELALETARNTLNEYSQANPEHEIAHIFMTDGHPTIGQQNNDILSEIVDNRFNNIFIGYGLDHNAILMKKLSEHRNADYQFVDDMENTGLVYGESVHQLLYPALKDVEIHADDGLIYDWETNVWKDVIFVNVLVSETEKLYQVKKNKIDNMEIDIYGKTLEDSELELLETVNQIPDLINIDTNHIDEVDLTKYMYRQKVQELLYIANKQNNNDSLNGLKTILKDVFKKMRTYMRDNNMLDDPFMKLLCDDISITYQNIGKLSGLSFTYNRQTSQGRQRAYNVRSSSNDDINLSRSKYNRYPQNNTPPFFLKRHCARSITNDFGTMDEFDDNADIIDIPTLLDEIINEGDEDEDDLDNYLVSNDITSCYSTPSVLNTMRSFSQNL
jgi:hypothetical protein